MTFLLPGMFCGEWFWRGVGWDEPVITLPGLYDDEKPYCSFVGEVNGLATRIKELAKGQSFILVAHSYGAQHALALSRREDLACAGLVLYAPAIGRWWIVRSGWRLLLAWVGGRRPMPRIFVTDLEEGEQLPLVRQRLVRMGGVRPRQLGLLAQLWGAIVRCGRGLSPDGQLPTKVVWAAGDRVIRPVRLPPAVSVETRPGGHFLFLLKDRGLC